MSKNRFSTKHGLLASGLGRYRGGLVYLVCYQHIYWVRVGSKLQRSSINQFQSKCRGSELPRNLVFVVFILQIYSGSHHIDAKQLFSNTGRAKFYCFICIFGGEAAYFAYSGECDRPIKEAVYQTWTDELIEEAKEMSSLCYLN